ncbi:hypothetical protein [Micromonospora globbae]|uniref:hypothetical protein n=1 Tax=Micromonospora globbae TaxID=1894969 RepID=UPI00386E121F|nr:hypothetical protein OH732_10595 [Micromonospora globbae]
MRIGTFGTTDRRRRLGRPFVFYTDRDTRRGTLLYRRYDGDLGLVAPATRGRDGQPAGSW